MRKKLWLLGMICLILGAMTACEKADESITLPENDAPPQIQTALPEVPDMPDIPKAPEVSVPGDVPPEEPDIPVPVEDETPVDPPASLEADYSGALEAMADELRGSDGAAVYDNGVITIPASHNQGRAGDSFWPYTVYQYDPAADCYQKTAWVDAWDRRVADGADWAGVPFPEDVDADGDGIVYYILPDGSYAPEGTPVDGLAYETWRASLLAGAAQVDIP